MLTTTYKLQANYNVYILITEPNHMSVLTSLSIILDKILKNDAVFICTFIFSLWCVDNVG